jgi:hypothetical protein
MRKGILIAPRRPGPRDPPGIYDKPPISLTSAFASCGEFNPIYRIFTMQSGKGKQGIAVKLLNFCLHEGHFIPSDISYRSRLIFFKHVGHRIIKSSPSLVFTILAKF